MIALLLAVLPLAYAASVNPEGHIVNGASVSIANFPWQGSYRTASGSHTCGCVFVGNNYVLTAAHCGGSTSYSMEFGSSNRGSGTVFRISSVTVHPYYDQGAGFLPSDVTVIVATNTISGSNISPASIPSSSSNPGGNGWITGWGRLCGSCSIPSALQGVQIPIQSDSYCSSAWGSSFQSTSMICVYSGNSGACNGDSGGPLTKGSTVYGLASWVATGCLSSMPSTYARVGAFTYWICAVSNYGIQGC